MQKGKKGSRIRHATKTEWGVGQLLEDANSQSFLPEAIDSGSHGGQSPVALVVVGATL